MECSLGVHGLLRRQLLSLLSPVAVLVLSACAAVPTREIHGRLIGPDGRPVRGASIGSNSSLRWELGSGAVGVEAELATDEEGRFSGHLRWSESFDVLVATDRAQRLGAAVRLDEAALAGPIEVTLKPLVSVRGEFSAKQLTGWRKEPRFEFVDVSMGFLPDGAFLGQWEMRYGKFSIRLPPGDYELVASGNFQGLTRILSLKGDMPEVDLGVIELQVPIIERLSGKDPPAWNVTDARNVDKNTRLSDFKGKWVLLEFWAYW